MRVANDVLPTATEDRSFRLLRLVSIVVILLCIVFLVVIDPIGRLFIDPSFHASELVLGTLIGALLLLLGIEVANRIPGLRNGK